MTPGSSLLANSIHEIGTGVMICGALMIVVLLILLLHQHISDTDNPRKPKRQQRKRNIEN